MKKDRLPQEIERALQKLLLLDLERGIALPNDYLEVMEAERRQREASAQDDLELVAQEILFQQAERKRLWGKKFPKILGQLPPDPSPSPPPPPKPFHPVKNGKQKAKTKKARTR